MWVTGQKGHLVVKTLLQYSSLTPLVWECYEGEVQPYRKTDYKSMMMMNSIVNTCTLLFQYYSFIIIITSYIHAQVGDLLSPQLWWEGAKGV